MTGALKLMLGIFAGGWKLGGNPPGRDGCCSFDCIPGGGAVPGAAVYVQHMRMESSIVAYPFLVGLP